MDDLYWLGFSAFPGVGPLRFQKLLQHFGDAQHAWSASDKLLSQVLGSKLSEKFLHFRKKFSLEEYQERLADKKITILLKKNTNYPLLLADVPTAPFVLYVKGNSSAVSDMQKSIAVVGTRKVSSYGEEVTALLTRELVIQGFSIISGLAIGVDTIAHSVAIQSEGQTIAVLGCGVDCCTPGINASLYDKIAGRFGAIVSESAFEEAGAKGVFPARNRIIAGLSLGVLVTEGAEDSGALITAQRALELNRPVFAVPGPITSQLSKGPLSLIQKGALLIQSSDDILHALKLQKTLHYQTNSIASDIPEEQEIISLLEHQPLYLDEIIRKTGKISATVGSLLSMMEVKGLVKNKGGKFGL